MFEHVIEGCTCKGKKCAACKDIKCHGAFGKSGKGLKSRCKLCRSLDEKAYRLTNPEKVKTQKARYREDNREKIRASAKVYNDQHVEYRQTYYQANKERFRIYRHIHRDQVRRNRRRWYHRHRQQRALYNFHYRQSHNERLRMQKRFDYLFNGDRYRARAAARRLANPDYEKTYRSQPSYREYRRDYARLHSRGWKARRRTLQTQAGGSYTAQEWLALKAFYNYTCLCCGRREPEIKLTADHVIPVTKHGSSNIENIQPLCKSCNSRKNNKIIDYRRYSDVI